MSEPRLSPPVAPTGLRLSGEERREHIVQWVQSRGRITVAEICRRFGVSEATARRDLEALAEAGRIQRVRGGAIPVRTALPEPPLLVRMHTHQDLKQRIGRAAAGLVRPGESVFIGSGTTALEVARHLVGVPGVTVITNSLPVLNLLAAEKNITVIGLGGMLRSEELSFIGSITERALAEVRAEKVFIGIRGISLEHGLTNEYLPEVLADRAILKVGRQVVVVADHTKLGVVAPVFVAPLEAVHTVVTDADAPSEFVEALRERGMQVLLA